jgi:hypothetical protein
LDDEIPELTREELAEETFEVPELLPDEATELFVAEFEDAVLLRLMLLMLEELRVPDEVTVLDDVAETAGQELPGMKTTEPSCFTADMTQPPARVYTAFEEVPEKLTVFVELTTMPVALGRTDRVAPS